MVKINGRECPTFEEFLEQNPEAFDGLDERHRERMGSHVVFSSATFDAKEQALFCLDVMRWYSVDPAHDHHLMVCYASKADMSDFVAILLISPETAALFDMPKEEREKKRKQALEQLKALSDAVEAPNDKKVWN